MSTSLKHELKIHIPLAVLLALAPFGYENFDLPHSKAVGLTSWAVCLIILGRIAWIRSKSRTDITFKHSSDLTWWRRQVIKYDIAGIDAYFASLEIPVP